MTTGIVASLGLFSYFTKKDFTISNVIWWILIIDIGHLVIGLLIGGIAMLSVIGSVIGATAFCVYLVIDIQSLMSGKRRALSIDDYIFASCAIYLDVINIFMKILQIMGEKKDKKKNDE